LNESRTSAVLDDALAARAARALAPAVHAQHATRLLVGLDGDVEVVAGVAVRGRAVLVAADLPHRATAAGPVLELAYDPEARAIPARGVAVVDGAPLRWIAGAVDAQRGSITRPDVLDGLAREVGARLATAPRRLDRRVAALLEALRDPDAAAERPRISAAHMRALFVRDVGVPIRTYALWRRALVGMGAFNRVDATCAAHQAGFADLAHFSRTCRRMFGAPPTALGRALL
jgi:AraC-like DNA-binding protein